MAGHGPPPKPAGQRRRQAAKATDPPRRHLAGGPIEVPELPGAEGLSETTRRWYETWARSPQASRFLATDWQRLHMVALLVEKFYEVPTKELFSEIRLNEACLGATEADRLRLRWDVEPPRPPAAKRAASTKRRTAVLRLLKDDGQGEAGQ